MRTARHSPALRATPEATALCLGREDILARTLQLIGARRSGLRQAHEAIAVENRASARSGPLPTDARLEVVSETVRRLQGTLLAPEDRRAVVQLGSRLGMRPFDTNLLMAVVQDRARRGEPLTSDPGTALRPRQAAMPSTWPFWRWVAAGLAGIGLAALAAGWLLGG